MKKQKNIRKRVCKACDRCRLKKSKCDGASPCSRCKAGNTICMFGERKRLHNKTYPKGYVEMLEQQRTQLVAGLQQLYSRLQNRQEWPGGSLRNTEGGYPLTHDILERLDLLHSTSDASSNYEDFEEDCNRMLQKLIERSSHMRNGASMSSTSDYGTPLASSDSGTPTTQSFTFTFTDTYTPNNVPSTPSINSFWLRQSLIASFVEQEAPMASSASMNTGVVEPSELQQTVWSGDWTMLDKSLDFSNFDQTAMMLDPVIVNSEPMMPDWTNNSADISTFVRSRTAA